MKKREEERRVDVRSMLKSLNVTLPVLAVMNGENRTSKSTVFPLSPFTLSVCVVTSIVAVSLLCVPPFICTVDPESNTRKILPATSGGECIRSSTIYI